MKKRILNSMLVFLFLATAMIGLSSFVTSNEDDEARKRAPEAGGCSFLCWYQDGSGNWYSVPHTGTFVDCPRVTYTSDCTPEACFPVVPC